MFDIDDREFIIVTSITLSIIISLVISFALGRCTSTDVIDYLNNPEEYKIEDTICDGDTIVSAVYYKPINS